MAIAIRDAKRFVVWAIFALVAMNLFIGHQFTIDSNLHDYSSHASEDLLQKRQEASTSTSPQQLQKIKVAVRAYPYWTHDFPCVNDTNPEAKDTGFIFIKVHKCASSTVARIIRRISRIYGTKNGYAVCKQHSEHGYAFDLGQPGMGMGVEHRKKDQSFLFTFIREPSKRFISDFFYHGISKDKRYSSTPSLANFTKFADFKMRKFNGLGGYELPYLITDRSMIPPQTPNHTFWNPEEPEIIQNPDLLKERVDLVLRDYDFIGVTSRMDESLVVFSMLLNIPLILVLYLSSSRVSGGYDYDAQRHKCFKIQKSAPTGAMKHYLKSDEWGAKIAGDNLLYRAANQNLDATIKNVIGKEKFYHELQRYRDMMSMLQKECGGEDCASTVRCEREGEPPLDVIDVIESNPKCDINHCLKSLFG